MTFDPSAMLSLGGSLLKAGLPALGTILGVVVPPPFNLMVGPAFAAISAAMGIDPATPNAPAAVQAAVDADPAAAVTKLQTIEQAHKDAADAINEELRIRTADVQDARRTEVVLASSPAPYLANASAIVSSVIVLGFIAIVGIMLFHPVQDNGVVSVLVGTMATAFGAVVNFYLGSSSGSQAKSDTLASLARAPTVNAGAGAHVSAGTISGGKR